MKLCLGRQFIAPVALALFLGPHVFAQNEFQQTNLVSDLPGVAAHTDPNLVNPWGISFSSTSPFWIADNGAGVSTLYNSTGTPQSLVVTIPKPGGGTAAPTGTVFNGNSAAFGGDRFIFASEDGTITGWKSGTAATTLLDNSAGGSVYKGLAISSGGGNSYLYATDFHNNRIAVLSSTGAPTLTGSFSDPTLPAGFAPFNIENIGSKLYVTYALQDAAGHDDVAGPGNGFVDTFNLNGDFLGRLTSGGPLNSPWGLALAPAGFGSFGGDLLVGNFGDGTINAYNPGTGNFVGTLDDPSGNPIVIEGLWGLAFGNGGSGGSPGTLYFAAGIPGDGEIEDHGLFGSLTAIPEPGTYAAALALASFGVALWLRRRQKISA
ncbi:MAG TPA: TIGR03118 family protein [Opitutaceae bacterium]|nr:TIGR03118 family protein [Opitutaceae bacterium]